MNISKRERKVAYVYHPDYLQACNTLPKVKGRASMVHSLITSYGMLKNMVCVTASKALESELTLFHSSDYLDCLKQLSNEEDEEKYLEEAEVFGLTYDCPAWPGVYEYGLWVAGASMKAAQCLTMGISNVAINWGGGWHHAKRDEASGYCYINDAVLAILRLRKTYERVLYVDLDLHHGDGVEDAFSATSKVMTVSFHKVAPGFFPGSGSLSNVGMSKGKYYTVNIPLKDGITDDKYFSTFKNVMSVVHESFSPEAVVCQCGADGLVGDPMATYNLTPRGIGKCLEWILDWELPTLLLGGGGYNYANTARCWTHLTAVALGEELSKDIPEHQYFTEYGPDYELHLEAGNRHDLNDDHEINDLVETIKENMECLKV